MIKTELYKELDRRLNDLMSQWWSEHSHINEDLGISTSGSVLFGTWRVQRDGFDGLKFRFTDDMITKFVQDKKITLTHDDMINQKEFEE